MIWSALTVHGQPESALEQHQSDWNSRAENVARENKALERTLTVYRQPECALAVQSRPCVKYRSALRLT